MRRETGLYMVLSLFDPFFIHIGVIFPIFQLSGNSPSEIEALMIMHSGPLITSTAILINFGDMKSIPELDLFFIAFIAFSTCLSVTVLRLKFKFLFFRHSSSFSVGLIFRLGISFSVPSIFTEVPPLLTTDPCSCCCCCCSGHQKALRARNARNARLSIGNFRPL